MATIVIKRKYIPLDENSEYRIIYRGEGKREALKISLVRKAFDEEGNVVLIRVISSVEFYDDKASEFLDFMREVLKERDGSEREE